MAPTLTDMQALELWRHAVVAGVRRDAPDLSARQMAVLLTVYLTSPPHTVRGLAATLNVSKPAITRARGEARSRGRILLARAYAEHPNWVKQGEELLLSVLLEEPENEDALLLLGRIYGGLGLRSRAVAMLGRVLDRHPEHVEAQGLITEIGGSSLSPGQGHARMKSLLSWRPG